LSPVVADWQSGGGGIEPAGESDASNSTASVCEKQEIPSAANTLHRSDTDCLSLALNDAALRNVVAAWNAIPDNIRRAIILLVESQCVAAEAKV
jgi:hypothetical protein